LLVARRRSVRSRSACRRHAARTEDRLRRPPREASVVGHRALHALRRDADRLRYGEYRVLPARRLGGPRGREARGGAEGGGDPAGCRLQRSPLRGNATRGGARPRLLPPPRRLEGAAQLLQPALEGEARPGGERRAPAGARTRHLPVAPRPLRAGGRRRAVIARILRRVEGSAVVEMAIVLPLFVLLALWAVYFTELSIVRIRQQEASRFLTWEATTQALVDFGSGRHAPRSQAMRREALARTVARYRNLEGHNLSERSGRWLARPRLRH